jgi:hypothetical protein
VAKPRNDKRCKGLKDILTSCNNGPYLDPDLKKNKKMLRKVKV